MQMNLRKAAALLARLEEIRRENVVPAQISLNIHSSNLEDELNVHNDETTRKIQQTREIIGLTYKIRGLIADKKSEYGVNKILTQLAECDALIVFCTGLSRAHPQADIATLKNRAVAAVSSDRNYASDDFMVAGSLSVSQITSAKAIVNTLKNKKTELNDQLIGVNVNTSIVLDASDVETLKNYGLAE